MLEQCPHCSAQVLFANEFCPACQRSRQSGQLAPGATASAPSQTNSNASGRIQSVVVAFLMFAVAAAGFWYAHQYRYKPLYTITAKKGTLRLSAQKMAEYLLVLVTPGTNNMTYSSALPLYREAKQEADKRRNVALPIQGGAILFALVGAVSLGRAFRQRKAQS